jgi:epoxyqueuosine reductase
MSPTSPLKTKARFPKNFAQRMGDRIYGCDDCLDACPWNRFAQALPRGHLCGAGRAVFQQPLRDFLRLDDEAFRLLFKKSPIKRIKRPAFLRNVCVVLGNVGSEEDLSALELAAEDPHPLIAEHARWAIREIQRRLHP